MRRLPGLAPKPVTSVSVAACAGVATIRTAAATAGTSASHSACSAFRVFTDFAPRDEDAGRAETADLRVRDLPPPRASGCGAPSADEDRPHPGAVRRAPAASLEPATPFTPT